MVYSTAVVPVALTGVQLPFDYRLVFSNEYSQPTPLLASFHYPGPTLLVTGTTLPVVATVFAADLFFLLVG